MLYMYTAYFDSDLTSKCPLQRAMVSTGQCAHFLVALVGLFFGNNLHHAANSACQAVSFRSSMLQGCSLPLVILCCAM